MKYRKLLICFHTCWILYVIVLAISLLLSVSGCTLHFKSTETELDVEPSGMYHLESIDCFKELQFASQSFETHDPTYKLCLYSPNRWHGDTYRHRGSRLALTMEMENGP